jgi:hypothetical protein
MKQLSLLGGIGAIAFAILNLALLPVGATPGGNYTPSDVISFVGSGHRPAVFVSLYLVVLSSVGLACLFAYVRQAIATRGDQQVAATLVWGAGLAVSIAFLLGWTVALSVPVAYAFSHGGFAIAPTVTYAIVEMGLNLVYIAGGIVMGLTLIGIFFSARSVFPVWLRRLTLVAGILGLASPTFFAFFALVLWGLVIGIWLVSTSLRSQETSMRSATERPAGSVQVS